jgi:hypothetical protein
MPILDQRPAAIVAIATLGLALSASAAPIAVRPQYTIDASVSLQPAVVRGTVTVLFTNESDATLRDVAVFLFPNRFAGDDDLTDLARPMIHPEEEVVRGGMSLAEVTDGDRPATWRIDPNGVYDTVVRVAISPLEPGATRSIRLGFRTEVPRRFGGFGEFESQLTLIGGWHPYIAALGADGEWKIDQPPPSADFEVAIQPESVMQLALNGRFSAGDRPLRAFVPAVPYLSLVASPRLLKATRQVGETTVTLLVRPKRFAHRVVPGPDEAGLIMNAAQRILENAPADAGRPPRELLLIEAPLRMHLIEAGEGMVVFSDRLFKVLGPLREFHEAHLAQAIYRETMRASLSGREPPRDYGWVAGGLSHEMAHRYMESQQPDRRLMRDWTDMFDFMAAVDRFEKVPKIPFVGSYFHHLADVDPTAERILTFNAPRPPGRVILSKVRDLVGEEAYQAMLADCIGDPRPLRECAAGHFPGRGVGHLIHDWNGPYPVENYWIEKIDFNERVGDGFRTTVEVRRETSRAATEPVTVRMNTVGGAPVDMQWNSRGEIAVLSETTPKRVYQVYIDPEEKLVETRRDDNAWLPRLEVLLDSADIEVSSTEFGFATNVVARVHQDYRKDLSLTPFYTSRGLGFAVGPRFHFGKPIDPTLFQQNVYLFYYYVGLDDGFDHRIRPDFITEGNTAGFGFRYDYTNVFYDQNPTLQRRVRLFADWNDGAFGSDFDFVNWGYDASLVLPLLSPKTLLGLQAINGFSEAIGDSVVPNQALFSLGGARSIRGIGFGDELGRNIFVVRGEMRQSIYPELDWNLLDVVTLRRTQFRAFVDSGNVSNSAGRIYDPTDWAVGIGAGFGLIYDAAGFFPAVAYLEIATRVDDGEGQGEVQVLFGTKQPF